MLTLITLLGIAALALALALVRRHRQLLARRAQFAAPARAQRSVCVVGCGLSGIQAAKTGVAAGHRVSVLEERSEAGGLWRFTSDARWPTVYESTHIDTSRDLNSFGDSPVPVSEPELLSHRHVARYLARELDRVRPQLAQLRFGCRVLRVMPVAPSKQGDAPPSRSDVPPAVRWEVVWADSESGRERRELFDAVLVCTGRHSVPHTPRFRNAERFRGTVLHSAEYKSPRASVAGAARRVCVVGVGNSGTDIATELARDGHRVWLVSRSGAWVTNMAGKPLSSMSDSALTGPLRSRLPFAWVDRKIMEGFRSGERVLGDQQLLDDAGLKPKHRWMSQHPTVTGLVGSTTLHDEVARGQIVVRRSIDSFTEDGICFDGSEAAERIDVVIYATGFKQAADFVPPDIVDLRSERESNAVPLYLGMFVPRRELRSLAFINYVQSASFLCADLQTRLFFDMLGNPDSAFQLPSDKRMRAEINATSRTLAERWGTSSRHLIQHGISSLYYDDLAEKLGVYPSLLQVLLERPSALWHATLAPVTALTFRLVGPGASENATSEIEARLTAMRRGGIGRRLGKEPPVLVQFVMLWLLLLVAKLRGHHCSKKLYREDYLMEELNKL